MQLTAGYGTKTGKKRILKNQAPVNSQFQTCPEKAKKVSDTKGMR